ncbi:hypothetical protein F4780DRAFT_784798 [Xylariomycetidae sp. FL0641]|nr:hypothetical protein F4780DRAFT_784798 [Xylariomycetidae sp. FL0641]
MVSHREKRMQWSAESIENPLVTLNIGLERLRADSPDLYSQQARQWANADRRRALKSTNQYLAENLDFPFHSVRLKLPLIAQRYGCGGYARDVLYHQGACVQTLPRLDSMYPGMLGRVEARVMNHHKQNLEAALGRFKPLENARVQWGLDDHDIGKRIERVEGLIRDVSRSFAKEGFMALALPTNRSRSLDLPLGRAYKQATSGLGRTLAWSYTTKLIRGRLMGAMIDRTDGDLGWKGNDAGHGTRLEALKLHAYQKELNACSPGIHQNLHRKIVLSMLGDPSSGLKKLLQDKAQLIASNLLSFLAPMLAGKNAPASACSPEDLEKSREARGRGFHLQDAIVELFELRHYLEVAARAYDFYFPAVGEPCDFRCAKAELGEGPGLEERRVEYCISPAVVEYPIDSSHCSAGSSNATGPGRPIVSSTTVRADGRVVCPAKVTLQGL